MHGLAAASALILVFGQQLARPWVGESPVPPVGLLVAITLWTVYGDVMSLCSTLQNAGRVVAPQVTIATVMTCLNLPLSIVLTIHVGLPGPELGSLIAHVITHAVPVALLVRWLLTEGIRK